MGSPQLLVLSPANPLRSYSGVKYLCDSLSARGLTLELWANIPSSMLSETTDWGYQVKSFWSGVIGKIPRIRYYSAWARAFWLAYRGPRVIITVDTGFIREMALAKKLRPEMVLIQYCPELFTPEDVPHLRAPLERYARYADVPDIVIDVEPNRATYRQNRYQLTKDVLVIPNTLPRSEMPARAVTGTLARLAGRELPSNRPILLYIGRGSLDRDWDLISTALAGMDRKPFFLAFCYGDVNHIAALREKLHGLLRSEFFHIADAVPRQALLGCIHEADAGLVYYRPSHSINHRYAAPTKLYEYLAAGLPVIASNNPGIVELVDDHGLGVCVENESPEALSSAIEGLLFDRSRLDKMRRNCLDAFQNELCYEVASRGTIDQITAICQGLGAGMRRTQ